MSKELKFGSFSYWPVNFACNVIDLREPSVRQLNFIFELWQLLFNNCQYLKYFVMIKDKGVANK